MKEGGGGGRCSGAKRQRKNNFGPPWNTRGKIKGGGGAVGRWVCSRNSTRREGKSGWVIGMLGQRLEMPRWENDLLWQLEMLEQKQGIPRLADEPVWCLWRGFVNLEGLGSIHNNKRQSLGFEQSLTEACKNHLIIRLHCSPTDTS